LQFPLGGGDGEGEGLGDGEGEGDDPQKEQPLQIEGYWVQSEGRSHTALQLPGDGDGEGGGDGEGLGDGLGDGLPLHTGQSLQ